LFDLFDFNETGSLAYFDLVHLLDTCIYSTLKMFKIPIKKISLNDDDLESLVEQYAFPTKRIQKLEFKRILRNDKYINRFLEILEVENFPLEESYYLNEKTFKVLKDEYLQFKQELIFSEESRKNQINFSK
jgi:hypothetical protein